MPQPSPIPQPLVDTLVSDGATGERRRRVEYSGTAWYGQPPDTGRSMVVVARGHLRDDTPFFLPDSLPYRRSELDGATIACTASLQATGAEATFVTAAEATWGEDPRDPTLAWVVLRLAVYGSEPLAVSYRVVTVCSTLAVASGQTTVDLR